MTLDELRAGDCLLYKPNSFWSYAIAIKTWNRVSHCEAYIGAGESVAARDGVGVGRYPLRTAGLVTVVRPPTTFDLDEAMGWFATVNGQKYDWLGLTRFVLWGSTPFNDLTKQFCSEFLTRWYRMGSCDPFNNKRDADSIAPAQFLYLPAPWECHDFEP